MCGIAGVYQLNGKKVPIDCVESIGVSMHHRGPDNFSVVSFEKLGLAHNRLSLLDLSPAANQPFRNDDYALVYNGEIYNFAKLRERLEHNYDIKFKTSSDTEVLFYSLIHEGIHETLKQIRGMFAFSFYDKANDELWLARDRLGIKPLYYFQHDGGFYWSSEIKALAKTFNIKPDPIKTLFSINGTAEKSNEYTMFKGIFPVKPGSYLRVKSNVEEPQIFSYYNILDDFEPEFYKELDGRSAKDVLSRFDSLFTESIKSTLISDAALGAFVSGGIDSSLISAVAKQYYPNLKLFTANIVGKFSEIEDAKELAQHIGAELFEHRFEPQQMLLDWAEATYFFECPIVITTNSIPFATVAKLARKLNVKAALTGEGADELFLGYPRMLTKRYEQIASLPVTFVKSFYKLIPGLDQYLFPNQKESSLKFANQLAQNFESSQISNQCAEKMKFLDANKRREQFLTIKMLGEHLVSLLYRNDRMGMMASIEARFPFLDEELVKFAINLPVKYKIGRSHRWHNYKHPFLIDKWIVRKAAEKYLPHKLVIKKKNGFPMQGHKFVRIKDGFFKNGWVEENLSLTDNKQRFMLESQNPYFIAKLASIEIFGRIYGLGENHETVKDHVLSHAEMIS